MCEEYIVNFDKNKNKYKISVTNNDLESFYNRLDTDYNKIINTYIMFCITPWGSELN